MNTIDSIIEALNLEPHIDAGWFAPTFRERSSGHRSEISAIYYLLTVGEVLSPRKLDGHHIWHFYDGAPVEVEVTHVGAAPELHILGRDLAAGQRPQVTVPAYCWHSCRSTGEWSLLGCTAAPGYDAARVHRPPA